MTDTPEVNDIPAILARAKKYAFGKDHDAARILTLDHVPNMAAEILSLRADKKRLDVLEELSKAGFSVDGISSFMRIAARPWVRFTTLREAADAELLSRREKENG